MFGAAMIALGWLLLASIGLEVQPRGAAIEDLAGLTHELTRALEEAAGQRVIVHSDQEPSCVGPSHVSCILERCQRLQHSDWVTVLVIGGPTRTRLVAERLGPATRMVQSEVDLARGESRADALGTWARRLFPIVALPPVATRPSDLAAGAVAESESPILPIVGATLGVAAIVAAVLMQRSWAATEEELQSSPHSRQRDRELLDDRSRYATGARLSAGAGVLFLGAAVGLFVFE